MLFPIPKLEPRQTLGKPFILYLLSEELRLFFVFFCLVRSVLTSYFCHIHNAFSYLMHGLKFPVNPSFITDAILNQSP